MDAPSQTWKLIHFRVDARPFAPRDLFVELCQAGLPKAYFPAYMVDRLEEVEPGVIDEDFERAICYALEPREEDRMGRILDMKELLNVVAWAFGPRGFPDLQILAFGDFTGGLADNAWSQITFCRQDPPTGIQLALHFRVMAPEDGHLWDRVERSREVVCACTPNDTEHVGRIDDPLCG